MPSSGLFLSKVILSISLSLSLSFAPFFFSETVSYETRAALPAKKHERPSRSCFIKCLTLMEKAETERYKRTVSADTFLSYMTVSANSARCLHVLLLCFSTMSNMAPGGRSNCSLCSCFEVTTGTCHYRCDPLDLKRAWHVTPFKKMAAMSDVVVLSILPHWCRKQGLQLRDRRPGQQGGQLEHRRRDPQACG